MGRKFSGAEPAVGMADEVASLDAQRVEELFKELHQVPQVVQMLQPSGSGNARMGRCVNMVVLSQAVQKIGPADISAGAVQIHQRIPGAAFGHLNIEHTAAHGNHPLVVSNHWGNTSSYDSQRRG